MAEGAEKTETDSRKEYGDIIDLPHWEPVTFTRMSMKQRAAQFAPFAALTGYEEMVQEEARETGRRSDLSEEETEELNRQILLAARSLDQGARTVCSITFFVPDRLKDGGEYRTVTEAVHQIDAVRRKIVLERKKKGSGAREEIELDQLIRMVLMPAD